MEPLQSKKSGICRADGGKDLVLRCVRLVSGGELTFGNRLCMRHIELCVWDNGLWLSLVYLQVKVIYLIYIRVGCSLLGSLVAAPSALCMTDKDSYINRKARRWRH